MPYPTGWKHDDTCISGMKGELCNEGEENYPANYDGEEAGFAQIKAHTSKKKSCPSGIKINNADNGGTDLMSGFHAIDWNACEYFCGHNVE